MKHYVMMTNEDFNALPTATTQIYFPQHGNEDCKRYFLDKDFSFNKLIPVPNYLYTMPGNLVEKALATYFTDYGLSSEPLSDFQTDVLKELGIDVPENPKEWYYGITKGIGSDRLERLHRKAELYCHNKQIHGYFCQRDFRNLHWGTPFDVLGYGVDVKKDVFSPRGTLLEKSGVFITLTTLTTPPLAWFKVFRQCFPAINFEISVNGKEIKELSAHVVDTENSEDTTNSKAVVDNEAAGLEKMDLL